MANKIQLRRGVKSSLPTLSAGEPAYTTDTRELYLGTGSGNINMGGSQWYTGTAMSGTSTATGAYYYSACPMVKLGDIYLNTTYGYVYQCTTAGSGTTAKWTYKGSIRGAKGETGPAGGTGAAGANGRNGSDGKDAVNTTIVVAASNSLHKDAADYVCTGSSDQTVIASAISALPSTGGKIVLLEGTYNLSGMITITGENVTIEGMGSATVLNCSSSSREAIRITTGNYCRVENLKIKENDNTNGALDLRASGCVISNVWFEDTFISVNASSASQNNILKNLRCETAIGIYLFGKHSTLSNCIISLTGNGSGVVTSGQYNTVSGNQIYGEMANGIHVDGSYHNISANTIVRGSGTASDYSSSQYSILVASGATYNLITNNLCPGKNYTNNGGNTNIFANNKYN